MSLKTELGKRLLDMIAVAKGSDPAIVLVVDEHTSRVLSSALRVFEVMGAGVLVIEDLVRAREKLPDMPALYFIEPTIESIRRLAADFPSGAKCHYRNAHLFLTTHVPQAGMDLLKSSAITKKIKSFVELNADFLVIESRIFTFDQPHTIRDLYFSTDATKLGLTLSNISKSLVSLCITCQEYPHIRYSAVDKSGICKGLATFFDVDMKKTISQLANWKYNESRERGTLLVLDRSIDPIAPLMHEFTFQAMVNDLLEVHGEIAHMPDADLVIAEDDHLWIDFRHKHIGSVIQDVTAKFREFKGANKMAVLQQQQQEQQQQDEKTATLKDMIHAMKDMPDYKTMMKKYHKHMTLAGECMAQFDANRLDQLGDLEQDMATGLDADGKPIKTKTMKNKLIDICQDARVSVLDKLRLVMIYTIGQGAIEDGTLKELVVDLDLLLLGAIRNLDRLGVRAKQTKERTEELKKRAETNDLNLMRYLPQMHRVVEQLVLGVLDQDNFPYASPPPPPPPPADGVVRKAQSARKKPAWKGGSGSGGSSSSAESAASSLDLDRDVRPRFIVFVLGGLTFSEMRSCYEIADKCNVNLLMGSTNTITPNEYIQDLSGLSDEAFKSVAYPATAAASSASNGR